MTYAASCKADDKPKAGHGHPRLSAMYNLVMTPLNFVAFLVSLVLIDIRYSLMRTHTHAHPHSAASSRLPNWLYALVHRQQPYDYDNGRRSTSSTQRPWYYHTKQKQLIKMEAEEAFRSRNTVVIGLVVGLVLITLGLWAMSTRLYRLGLSSLTRMSSIAH
jgi:hypothetical protein